MTRQPSTRTETGRPDPLGTDHLQADLAGRSVRGGILTVSAQGVRFLLQLLSIAVLARLLVPADYGL